MNETIKSNENIKSKETLKSNNNFKTNFNENQNEKNNIFPKDILEQYSFSKSNKKKKIIPKEDETEKNDFLYLKFFYENEYSECKYWIEVYDEGSKKLKSYILLNME